MEPTEEEEQPEPVVMFDSLQHLLSYYGYSNFEELKRRIYKDTDCGAWINQIQDGAQQGVQLGSIVEGSDAEVNTKPLWFPFSKQELERTIAYIEEEVDELWTEANNDSDDDEKCLKDMLTGQQVKE